MFKVTFAELHNPLFLSGSNLGVKLDPSKRTGMELSYDDDNKRLIVIWNGKAAAVPDSNVASFQPLNPKDIGAAIATPAVAAPERVKTAGSAPMRANISGTAQVSDPSRGMK